MDKAFVFVKDVGSQCFVETRNDTAEDVRAALETVGLHISASMPVDIRSNVYQFIVSLPDGKITAENVRALLRGNDDIILKDDEKKKPGDDNAK